MIICSALGKSFGQFLAVTLIFMFVLAITYFTTRWIGNYQKKQVSHGNIKIIECTRISSSKVLEVVKAGDKAYLIAVCKDTVTCIGEVNEESFETPVEGTKGESFGNVFNRFKFSNSDRKETEDDEPK